MLLRRNLINGGRVAEVRICEVGPRDGLQAESAIVPTAEKIQFVNALSRTGLREIEVSSFVSSRWVPQLGDASEVFAGIERAEGVLLSALVPNERGLDAALAARVGKVGVFVAASETFSSRNTNGTIAAVLDRLAPVVKRARSAGVPVRGYVSCVIACPYEGPITPASVRAVSERLLELGVDELDLGDTIGVAHPHQIEALYEELNGLRSPGETTLHLHDTSGRAIECARRAVAIGVRSFDASAGGLGGCPFAPGAPGNLATESLLELLESLGHATGIDRAAVAAAGAWMRARLRVCRPPA